MPKTHNKDHLDVVLQNDKVLSIEKNNKDVIEQSVTNILKNLGENPNREGLLKTPHRVANSLFFLTRGYAENPVDILKNALFEEQHDEMIVVKDIQLYSLCEHHLLPFFGKAHIAYIPRNKIVGLSKIARVVEVFSRRLQVQERMTHQIAEVIQNTLDPLGTAVMLECQHLCMQMRGVQKQASTMITSTMLGGFRNNASTREEFMSFIKRSNS